MDYNSGASKSGLSANDRAALMGNIKQQLDIAHAQELLQNIGDKCFKMCIHKPGSSLSNSDQKCLSYCIDRYFDAMNIVSKTYTQRIQKELKNAR